MKHTQSEWLYSKYSGGDYGVYSIKGNANDIALVRSYAKEDEVEANAKLIAAAPELLEALQNYVDSMLNKDEQQKWFNKYNNDKEANQVLVSAIAAIQKATN